MTSTKFSSRGFDLSKFISKSMLPHDVFALLTKELAKAVSVTAGFELWKIDKDDLVRSVNSAAELYKRN